MKSLYRRILKNTARRYIIIPNGIITIEKIFNHVFLKGDDIAFIDNTGYLFSAIITSLSLLFPSSFITCSNLLLISSSILVPELKKTLFIDGKYFQE